jgi:predicted RNA-binding protein
VLLKTKTDKKRQLIMLMKTNMRRIWLAVSVSALAMASLSGAAEPSATISGPEKMFTGTVSAVDLNEHTLKIQGTLLFAKKFNLGAACSYTFLGNPNGAEAGLHPGQKITVNYQNADGVLVADRIEQQPMRFAGWVKAVDPGARTVTVRPAGFEGLGFGKRFEFADGCRVALRGDKVGTFADIQAGNYVTLTYETPPGLPTIQRIDQTSEQFTGSLTAIDLDGKTVKAKTAFDTKSFNVGDHCVIVIHGKNTGHLSDLKPDDQLVFTYDEINGVNVVNHIAPAKDTTSAVSRTAPMSGY